MNREQLYDQAIGNLEKTVHDLAGRLPPPEMTTFAKSAEGYRYAEPGPLHAIVQKMVRIVSGLRAARILLAEGFIQEQAAICRIVDEAEEDVMFLAYGTVVELTELHKNFLAAFYLEEFEDASRPMQTRIKRPNIPRDRIHAYLSSLPGNGGDPSTGKAAMQAVHKTASGFVHGASPYIMEMYGGMPGKFNMNGMRGTPLWHDHRDDLWNYINRGIMCFAMTAKAFGDDLLCGEIIEFSRAFEATEPR